MKKIITIVILLFTTISFSNASPIKVVTTTMDLKSITEMVGGNKVSVLSIATGYQNPHFVDPKPSYIISLSNANLFVTVGLDLETGWSPQLLSSSRNSSCRFRRRRIPKTSPVRVSKAAKRLNAPLRTYSCSRRTGS